MVMILEGNKSPYNKFYLGIFDSDELEWYYTTEELAEADLIMRNTPGATEHTVLMNCESDGDDGLYISMSLAKHLNAIREAGGLAVAGNMAASAIRKRRE